jgi:hypothetical protein
MISLLYVSSASRLLTETELVELLRVSRENNQRDDITGMLLYKGGNFMQVIEGPEEAVRKLYDKILRDSRHSGIMTLLEEQIQDRSFPNWSMGFQNLDKFSPEELEGFTPFLNEKFTSETFQKNPNRAYVMLETFKKHMR